MELMKPIINLNGTTVSALVDARIGAREACLKLMEALFATAPHGRDYVGNSAAYNRDLAIYRARFAVLDGLYNVLVEEALAIQGMEY